MKNRTKTQAKGPTSHEKTFSKNQWLEFIQNKPLLNLCADSKKLTSESVFFALVGQQSDGHQFIQEAVTKKVPAIIAQKDHLDQVQTLTKDFSGEVFFVPDTRKAWTQAWQTLAQHPDKDLFVVGLTGTNGKTSMAHMVEHIFKTAQKNCAVMGTINHHLGSQVWETDLTTPGPEKLFPRLKDFLKAGAQACVMEISSHALVQNRARGLNLDVAVFSNLSEDHLDYHQSMQNYFEAKNLLFKSLLQESEKSNKVAVVNFMDAWAQKLSFPSDLQRLFCLVEVSSARSNLALAKDFIENNKDLNANLVTIDIQSSDIKGSHFYVEIYEGLQTVEKIELRLPVIGRFQVMNWTQAMLATWGWFLDFNKSSYTKAEIQSQIFKYYVKAAQTFTGTPGRMQKVLNIPANVFIDYAHTPDALENSLQALKEACPQKIHLVFGCGGDRDTEKRPMMACAAEKFADRIIVTSDNPRTEDPQKIVDQIVKGFKTAQPEIILDRKQAIIQACQNLGFDDVLLIAGKGHEDYQIIGTEKKNFSDYDQVLDFFSKKGRV